MSEAASSGWTSRAASSASGRLAPGARRTRGPRTRRGSDTENDIAPIPGTKRVSRVEENVGADDLELSAEQLRRLDELPPAEGEHHTEEQMHLIER